jgi:hypothetical protein
MNGRGVSRVEARKNARILNPDTKQAVAGLDTEEVPPASEILEARGFRWWFPQVMTAASWAVLLYLAMCFFVTGDLLGPDGPEYLRAGSVMLALPVLSLWAAVGFLFDQTRTRAWVGPSSFIFLVLSAIPSLLIAWIYTLMVAYLVVE